MNNVGTRTRHQCDSTVIGTNRCCDRCAVRRTKRILKRVAQRDWRRRTRIRRRERKDVILRTRNRAIRRGNRLNGKCTVRIAVIGNKLVGRERPTTVICRDKRNTKSCLLYTSDAADES